MENDNSLSVTLAIHMTKWIASCGRRVFFSTEFQYIPWRGWQTTGYTEKDYEFIFKRNVNILYRQWENLKCYASGQQGENEEKWKNVNWVTHSALSP